MTLSAESFPIQKCLYYYKQRKQQVNNYNFYSYNYIISICCAQQNGSFELHIYNESTTLLTGHLNFQTRFQFSKKKPDSYLY